MLRIDSVRLILSEGEIYLKEQHIQELKAILNVFDLMITDEKRIVNVEDWLMATRPKLEAIIEFFNKPIIAQKEHDKPKTNKEVLQMLHRDYPEFFGVMADNITCFRYLGVIDKATCQVTNCGYCWEKAIE